ncbi:transmembrane 9 superfamily member 3 [[Candida] anglica]|uniref:Transmembrane 9 superfamily member n=1 Tax=[Candida] anglica TaxID=148631 RepID=A0ABP0EDH1_9ASCO
MNCWIIIPLLLSIFQVTSAINLGYSPTYYTEGQKVELLVNKVESDHTQLPYGYYDLPFVCPAGSDAKPLALSLGQILRGDRIWQSNYDLRFGIDVPCIRLCDLISRDKGLGKADKLIRDGYVAHWLVDGLPGATTFVSGNNENKYYAAGFPLGFVKDDISYIYNHVMLVIRYHRDKKNRNKNTIVGFEVYPKSVSNELCPGNSKNYENFAITFESKAETAAALKKDPKYYRKTIIPYTYAVYWREDNSIDYDSRWDLYYENESGKNSQIHWLSVINSVVLMFLLSMAVAIVLVKIFKKDLQQPMSPTLPLTDRSLGDNGSGGSGWRSLIGDVHQQPSLAVILSVFVSSGVQVLIVMIGVVTIFTLNSQFSLNSKPSNMFFNSHQGAFFSLSLSFFVFSGVIPSYIGIILHKYFHNESLTREYPPGKYVKLSVLFSGFLPTVVLTIVLTINFFVWAKSSSYALPFGTIVVLLLFFFGLQLPLGVIGGYYGNAKRFDSKNSLLGNNEKETNDSKSVFSPKIYKRPLLFSPLFGTIVLGLIPFGIIFVELHFIFNSVWLEKTTFYYMYGFLLVAAISLVVVIIETTIVVLYVSFTVYHNPRWQWLCFRVGASIGWYIFAYSTYYFFFALHVRDFVSILLYFAYMTLVSGLIGIACGSVGVITGLIFVGKIFGTVKID